MVSLTGDEKVDKLCIIVFCDGVDQLLALPRLTTGTEQALSDAIVQTINEWNLNDNIKAFSFDTASANTGRHNGACTLLDAKLGHDALYLACRHHIHEIISKKCFRLVFALHHHQKYSYLKRLSSSGLTLSIAIILLGYRTKLYRLN